MEELYLPIRSVHIGAVILSGSLFLVRVLGHNLLHAKWPMASPLRILAWTVDTVLLTAALMLMTIVQQYPFADSWLTAKVLLLFCYIVVGWWAFRANHRKSRLICTASALAIFAFIITVARSHNPFGFLSMI